MTIKQWDGLIKMTQKSEIGIEEKIKIIRTTCDNCSLRENCRILFTVNKILEQVITFWNDCCPQINAEAE